MTYKEKFIKVFGVEPKDFPEETWEKEYRKLCLYCFVLLDGYGNTHWRKEPIAYVSVYATNAKQARQLAIQKLGKQYKKFSSGRPAYTLKMITEVPT